MGKSGSNNRTFNLISLLAIVLLLGSCGGREKTVCGVPVKGTPWEFAAAIHDKGDGTFMPETVDEYRGKAYIRGWVLPDELPAVVVCDVQEGKVVEAVLEGIIE